MIKSLPTNLRSIFEKHGIEDDSLFFDQSSVVVEFDDIEVAFQVREEVLELHRCCLTSKDNQPHLLIHNLLENQ